MAGAFAGTEPDVRVELQADDTSLFEGQVVRVHIDVLLPALKLGDEWLSVHPILPESPPRLLVPWIRGTRWLELTVDLEDYLRDRVASDGVGFLINDLFQEDLFSALHPGFVDVEQFQRPVRFDRTLLELPGGGRVYRYRLSLPYRAVRVGTTTPLSVHLTGEICRRAEPVAGRRIQLLSEPVLVQSNKLVFRIEPLPSVGRPPTFTGAVGRFKIQATADPTDVRVGEPISLRVVVEGDGDLTRFGPPRLGHSPGWEKFRVYEEPVDSGTEGAKRFFVFRIRPRSPDTDRIPPILWSYFDPSIAAYQTVATRAIPIHVEPVQMVSIAPRDESDSAGSGGADTAGNTLARNRPVDDLLSQHGPLIRRVSDLIVLFLAPGVLLVLGVAGRAMLCRTLLDPQSRARRRAVRAARRLVRDLDTFSPEQAAARVRDAVGRLLAVAVDAAPGEVMADEMQSWMAQTDQPELFREVAQVLRECEAVRFGRAELPPGAPQRWARVVERLATALTRSRSERGGIAGGRAVLLLVAPLVPLMTTLTLPSARSRLESAAAIVRKAAALSGELDQRRQLYRLAAAEYEAVAAEGWENGYLFFNLGNCYLYAGELPKAIAAYETARFYIPRDRGLLRNLAAARQQLEQSAPAGFVQLHRGRIDRLADAVLEVFSLRELELLWLTPWLIGWGLLYIGIGGAGRLVRRWGLGVIAVSLAVAVLYMLAFASLERTARFVVLRPTVLRVGPGVSYDGLESGPLPAGIVIHADQRLGEWWRVRLGNGMIGWCNAADLQSVVPQGFRGSTVGHFTTGGRAVP